jgi:hypothetical protein
MSEHDTEHVQTNGWWLDGSAAFLDDGAKPGANPHAGHAATWWYRGYEHAQRLWRARRAEKERDEARAKLAVAEAEAVHAAHELEAVRAELDEAVAALAGAGLAGDHAAQPLAERVRRLVEEHSGLRDVGAATYRQLREVMEERDRLRERVRQLGERRNPWPGGAVVHGGSGPTLASAPACPVERPAHYDLTPEPIVAIEGWNLAFNLGNVVKYIARAGRKAGSTRLDDLRKASRYLAREIAREERMGVPHGE